MAFLRLVAVAVAGLVLFASLVSAWDETEDAKSYKNYKLLRTSVLEDVNVASTLMSKLDATEGVHFWTFPTAKQTSDILVSPERYAHVQSILESNSITHEVLHEDIDKLIQAEKPDMLERTVPLERQANGHNMDWKTYHPYADIYGYCEYLARSSQPTPSGAVVTMEVIGKTTEGRNMVLMRVASQDRKQRKAIWLDAGIHAREWISPAAVTYILNVLVTDKEKSKDLLDAFDWLILPVINIDGYEHTHKVDRMWRKTRRPNGARSSNRRCIGTDPNRNFAYKWGGEGSSKDPCSEVYCGPNAFSEPETRAVRDAIMKRKSDIAMYLAFHAYSQLILVPWSGDRKKPADYNQLANLATRGQQAIRNSQYGTQYRVGTAPDLIYVATGGADDWAKAGAGIKYSYTFELRDTGRSGFILPKEQIIPSGIETFNGVRAMALALRNSIRNVDVETEDGLDPASEE